LNTFSLIATLLWVAGLLLVSPGMTIPTFIRSSTLQNWLLPSRCSWRSSWLELVSFGRSV
jgi:hypothetical protein